MIRRTSLILALAGALAVVPAATAVTVQIDGRRHRRRARHEVACFFLPSKTSAGDPLQPREQQGPHQTHLRHRYLADGRRHRHQGQRQGRALITLWGSRKKASARASIRYFELTKGDSFGFRIKGVDTGCAILDLPNPDARYSRPQGRVLPLDQDEAHPQLVRRRPVEQVRRLVPLRCEGEPRREHLRQLPAVIRP